MTTNQTIDGVSRKLLTSLLAWLERANERNGDGDIAEYVELRALLDAKPSEVTGDDVLRWMDEHAAAQAQGWPLGEIVEFGTGLKEVSWREGKMPALGTKLYAEQLAPVAVVPELTSELRWILGQMCFQHTHTAQALRLMGHEIARKAEDEQAVTITGCSATT